MAAAETVALPRRHRLLFIIRSLGVGGAERQLAVTAMGLAARGDRVRVVTYYGGGQWVAPLERAGVEVRLLGKRGRWDLLGPLRSLAASARAFSPDVVYGFLPDGNLLALLVGRWIARAAVVWGVRAASYDFAIYDRLFRVVFRLSSWLSRWPDLIVANSEAGREYHVAQGYPRRLITVIPNGIDTGRFRPDEQSRARMRREWAVEASAPLIGAVGRLDPMKDHPTFLRAAGHVIHDLPAAQFAIIGDGPDAYRRSLEHLAAEADLTRRVLWIREPGDMAAVYNALDLLVSTSVSGEGFSNVVGEAMACGVRCVVTPAGDSARIVGESGAVVAPGRPDLVAEACIRLLNEAFDPAVVRERIVREFGVEALLDRTEEALRSLARRREGTSR